MARSDPKMISEVQGFGRKNQGALDALKTFSEVTNHMKSVQDWLAWIGSILAFLGIGANSVDGSDAVLANLRSYPWPLRIAVFLVVSVALGWGLGALVARLRLHRNEVLMVGAHLLTFCVAAVVISMAESLPGHMQGTLLPQTSLLAIIGCGAVLMLLTRRMQAVPGQSEIRALRARCGIVLTFSASALALLLFADIRHLDAGFFGGF